MSENGGKKPKWPLKKGNDDNPGPFAAPRRSPLIAQHQGPRPWCAFWSEATRTALRPLAEDLSSKTFVETCRNIPKLVENTSFPKVGGTLGRSEVFRKMVGKI